MSDRKVEVDTTKGTSASGVVSPEERKDKKARLAAIYHRGLVGDSLHVELPPDLHGEWVPRHDAAINRKLSLGYVIDQTYAPKQKKSLHDQGDGGSHIVDVVFMTCSKETKELLDEIKREKFNELHAKKGNKQKEEKDYVAKADAETVPTVSSSIERVGPANIADAIKAAANQS